VDRTDCATKITVVLDHATLHAAPAAGRMQFCESFAHPECAIKDQPPFTLLPDIPDDSRSHSELLCSCLQSNGNGSATQRCGVKMSSTARMAKIQNASNGCTQSKNERTPFGFEPAQKSERFQISWKGLRGEDPTGSTSFEVIDDLTIARRRHGSSLGKFCTEIIGEWAPGTIAPANFPTKSTKLSGLEQLESFSNSQRPTGNC
jgi:hypothetical protein